MLVVRLAQFEHISSDELILVRAKMAAVLDVFHRCSKPHLGNLLEAAEMILLAPATVTTVAVATW